MKHILIRTHGQAYLIVSEPILAEMEVEGQTSFLQTFVTLDQRLKEECKECSKVTNIVVHKTMKI